MQKIDPSISVEHKPEFPVEAQPSETPEAPYSWRRRLGVALIAVLAVVMLALLPPLVNVNRFQRRIATSISGSLGRPVHLDRVTLSLLPLPGFTLENFVVSEDLAFGSEPIIRANKVRATLRLSSLWRRRVEFSTISFTEPSVNLVHTPEGKWNIESILLQASRISAAPTAQAKAGPAPRFPYIEATGARVNLKQGVEKTPFSLTDAEFALWLPNPEQWHLRLQGRPLRTDTSVSDTGTVRLEATLGRATSLEEVPLELNGSWRGAPLGEATRFVFGRDAGWRGELALETAIHGTTGKSAVEMRLRVNDARREDFVPDQSLTVDFACRGESTQLFHSFADVRCSWPPVGGDSRKVALSGAMPDVRDWRASTAEAGIADVSANALVGWWHVLSSRVPAGVSANGTLSGSVTYDGRQGARLWDGALVVAGASLKADGSQLLNGDVSLRSVEQVAQGVRGRKAVSLPPSWSFQLEPVGLDLGGHDPATLSGQVDGSGYTLHLVGMVTKARLEALAVAIPQLGDGLGAILPTDHTDGPFRVDLAATRLWGETQVWHDNTAGAPRKRSRR
jgi:AsmA protein